MKRTSHKERERILAIGAKMSDDSSNALRRAADALEAGKLVDPMQCDLCGKITDWLDAKTRWKRRHTDLGNALRTDETQWQCKHCLAWND